MIVAGSLRPHGGSPPRRGRVPAGSRRTAPACRGRRASGKPAEVDTMARIRIIIIALSMLAMAGRAKAQDSDDPAAVHTRLVVIRPEKGSEARPIVALANPTATADPDRLRDTIGGILARELFRQALLIAARDEMGLPTRDELLGDAPTVAADGAPTADLSTVLRPGTGASQALLRRAGSPPAEFLLAQRPAREPLTVRRATPPRRGHRAAVAHRVPRGAAEARAGGPAESHPRRRRAAARSRGSAVAAGLYRAVRGRPGPA